LQVGRKVVEVLDERLGLKARLLSVRTDLTMNWFWEVRDDHSFTWTDETLTDVDGSSM
jgi:hypothetical protein